MPESVHKHRPPPQAIDPHPHRAALRSIATVEALKGAAALTAGLGLLLLLHKDAAELAEHLLSALHLSPEGHFSRALVHAADTVTDAKLWAIAAASVIYSTVRFVEAYGLWNARVWAEWFALLSGAIYLPWEIYEILVHPGPLRWGLFLTNLAIVVFMLWVRIEASRPVPD